MKLAALALPFALAACSSAAPAPAPISNTHPTDAPPLAQRGDGLSDGALWTCQISDYDQQPCKLSRRDDGWYLTKLLGSQRFRGTLEFRDRDTAHFVGAYFCPWGACDADMDFELTRQADRFVGTFGDTITIRYDASLAEQWGGAGYGGLTGDEQ